MKYNLLTLIKSWKDDATIKKYYAEWLCDCGNTKQISISNVITSNVKSCGCYRNKIDLAGKIVGRWTVISEDKVSKKLGNRFWFCKCECGNTASVSQQSLVKLHSQSCGCLHKERAAVNARMLFTTHGLSDHPLREFWNNMFSRCNHTVGYFDRGILVESRWCGVDGLSNFIEDMWGDYFTGATLDRIDVDGNYHKENCRWVDISLQAYNKRKRRSNSSGVVGVSFDVQRGKWVGCISKGGRTFRKRFYSFDEAVSYRRELELKLYGENLKEGVQ